MNSRERVTLALNHQEPDRVPLDLGGCGQTGMHVSTVYKLRQALGLDDPGTPVKVVEPYQMLGEIKPDLLAAVGGDIVPLGTTGTLFGFRNEGWKPWTFHDGTPLLVPECFNTEPEPNGDILMYAEGDRAYPPSGRMPAGGWYFDSIPRQQPIDDAQLNVEDNVEEFVPISDADLAYLASEAERLYTQTDKAIMLTLGGAGFGDIALVPGPMLKNPKGIRDVTEWYMSTVLRRDYVAAVFERQCAVVLENLPKIYAAVGDRVTAVWVSGTDFRRAERPLHLPPVLPRAVQALLHPGQRLDRPAHALEALHSLVRLGQGSHSRFFGGGVRVAQPGADDRQGHGPGGTQAGVRRSGHVLGRRGGYPVHATLRHARRSPRRGAGAAAHPGAGRRLRVQPQPQHPGPGPGGEHPGDVRNRAGLRRLPARLIPASGGLIEAQFLTEVAHLTQDVQREIGLRLRPAC